MNELALFAGAGGGILGGKLLGWRPVCAVEINRYSTSVLLSRQNDGILPPFPIWDDICSFDGKPWRGSVDVVSGGFPCQDISSAGKGAGIEGERSGLWFEMLRIVNECEPPFVFIENSPLLRKRGLSEVLSGLAKSGFDAEWGCLSAGSFGAPHKRQRMWILAAHPNRVQEWEKSHCGKTGRVGREFKSVPWNISWQSALSKFRRMDDGLARNVDATDAIRNGQVPLVAASAWIELHKRITG